MVGDVDILERAAPGGGDDKPGDDDGGMGAGWIALAVVGGLLGAAALFGVGFVGGIVKARRRQLEKNGVPINATEERVAVYANPGFEHFQTKL